MRFAGTTPDLGARVDQAIAEALVVAFRVIMSPKLANCLAQRLLAEEDQPVQTFFLEAPHEALQMGVQPARMSIRSCQGWRTQFMVDPTRLEEKPSIGPR
jgi:hypothetical protein